MSGCVPQNFLARRKSCPAKERELIQDATELRGQTRVNWATIKQAQGYLTDPLSDTCSFNGMCTKEEL